MTESNQRWRDVSRLFHEAVAVAPADRAEFLRRACGSDDELRAEIEALLMNDSGAGRFFQVKNPSRSLIVRRIGIYEITSLIGAGGMGEVYRARDTRLGRDVAIKILPRAFTADPERLARFEREARVLAALSHHNIATIYGVEESDGIPALVMEMVPGETLAERIARSPLPMTEVLAIARQIAEALEAAHDKAIVHRDLKPANIKITPSGSVKVLDFGLAKAIDEGTAQSVAPSITLDATDAGRVLGTAAYMSPEQARGDQIDKRADIWAFGAVLYEMLTGKRAFGGDGVQDTLVAIMRDEPDWERLPATLSRDLSRSCGAAFTRIRGSVFTTSRTCAWRWRARSRRPSRRRRPPHRRRAGGWRG